jgi:hypothetical protein
VVDFQQFKYSPGWNIPIYATPFENATLSKRSETLDGAEVRYLSMQATGEDLFGPASISFAFDIPSAGTYKVEMEAVTGPDQGQIQMFRNERPAGEAVDLFSSRRQKSKLLLIGELPLQAGKNHLFFRLTGKNPQSVGLGFTPVSFLFSRVD